MSGEALLTDFESITSFGDAAEHSHVTASRLLKVLQAKCQLSLVKNLKVKLGIVTIACLCKF